MLYTLVILLLVANGLTSFPSSKRRFGVDLYHLDCTNTSAVLKHLNCELKKLGQSRYVVNVDFMSNQDLGKDIEAHLAIQIAYPKDDKILTLLDLKISLCDALRNIFVTPLLKDLMDEVRRSSKVPYTCPFKKNVQYKIQNYSVTDSTFPVYYPYTNFTFRLNFQRNQNLIGEIVLQGALVPKS